VAMAEGKPRAIELARAIADEVDDREEFGGHGVGAAGLADNYTKYGVRRPDAARFARIPWPK
jgi:hypothetical protein